MLDEIEFKELSDYVDEQVDKQVEESMRTDTIVWALMDIIKAIREITNDKKVIDLLDKANDDIMAGA